MYLRPWICADDVYEKAPVPDMEGSCGDLFCREKVQNRDLEIDEFFVNDDDIVGTDQNVFFQASLGHHIV